MATDSIVPAPNRIDPATTAMLFFDCNRGHLRPDDPEARREIEASGVVDALRRIERACRAAGIVIFYTKIEHRPDRKDIAPLLADLGRGGIGGGPYWHEWTDDPPGPWTPNPAGSPLIEILDDIQPQPDDYVIAKQRWSAFHETNFMLHLRRNRIDTLMIAGGRTEIGVASTVYAARDRDFNVVVLADACDSVGRDDINTLLLEQVFPIFSRVMRVDDAIGLIREAAAPV